MTPLERKLYQRGYRDGLAGKWPKHKPPRPPDELIARLMNAATTIRNGVDNQLAMLGPDEEWEQLGPLIDEVDAAMEAVTDWLKEPMPNNG